MVMSTASYPLVVRGILRDPELVMSKVQRAVDSGLIERAPNAWQVCLGILRMSQRLLFRWDTVGTAPAAPVRKNWRAQLLQYRPARFPFLVKEKLIAPFDLTGMLASPEQVRRHVMGAYHAGDEFHYDLQLLSIYPGELERLRDEVRDLVRHDTPRHRFLRDLNAYEGYHESLAEAVEQAIEHGVHRPELDDDPDWSLVGYLDWCARQPQTAAETWALQRSGRFELERGRLPTPRPGDERLDELLALGPRELMRVLQAGHPIDPESLVDKSYRGVSLGLPSVVDRLAWKTFQKTFHRDPETGALVGWNVRLHQDGYGAPLRPRQRGGKDMSFGHFHVVSPEGRGLPRGSGRGLLIDYSRPRKPAHDLMAHLRDPIVALESGSAEFLLGWSYLELGPRRVPTPSFFLLSHPEPLDPAVARDARRGLS